MLTHENDTRKEKKHKIIETQTAEVSSHFSITHMTIRSDFLLQRSVFLSASDNVTKPTLSTRREKMEGKALVRMNRKVIRVELEQRDFSSCFIRALDFCQHSD